MNHLKKHLMSYSIIGTAFIVILLTFGITYRNSLINPEAAPGGPATCGEPGTLDLTFGDDGYVDFLTPIYPYDTAVQSDRKIVVVGMSNYKFAVRRFNANGSIDTTFADQGNLILDLWSDSRAYGVAFQNEGTERKILVTGYYTDTGHYSVLVRLNDNGTLDNLFGNSGVITWSGPNEIPNNVGIQEDGKIVVTGKQPWGSYLFLRRFNEDGTLDETFGNNGITTTNIAHDPSDTSLLLHPNGGIFLAGYYEPLDNNSKDALIVGYNGNGNLNTQFGNDGIIGFPIGNYNDEIFSITSSFEGKILVSGSFTVGYGPTNVDMFIKQYNLDGSIDLSFGNSGLVILEIPDLIESQGSMALQPNGKIIQSGYDTNNYKSTTVRYKTNGEIDTSFGNNGTLESPSDINQTSHGIRMQGTKKYILISTMNPALSRFCTGD